MDNIKTFLIATVLLVLTGMIGSIPWWGAVIPILALGLAANILKWRVSAFSIGFISGFVVWFGANLFFDITLEGTALYRIGVLASMPVLVILLIAGVIGGCITGLALYAGNSLLAHERKFSLDE